MTAGVRPTRRVPRARLSGRALFQNPSRSGGFWGLYPLAPGDGVWELGAPLFERAELWIPAGGGEGYRLVIESPGAGRPGHGVGRARLNGEELPALRVKHARIARGGVLRLLK